MSEDVKISGVDYDFSGKTVLVTGATKGIGREIALAFARAGAVICVTGRNEGELASLAKEADAIGTRCLTRRAELAIVGDCESMVEYFQKETGGIDILINNAGLSFPETIADLDFDHWDTTLAVNLRAPAVIAKAVAADMVKRGGGAIVNVSSNAGTGGLAEHAAYCASKFGLHGLAAVMAVELGPKNVRVNTVAPTITLTPMGTQVWGDPKKADPVKASIPLGRFALPSDVSNAVLYLASDAAAMVHGTVMIIDGGAGASLY